MLSPNLRSPSRASARAPPRTADAASSPRSVASSPLTPPRTAGASSISGFSPPPSILPVAYHIRESLPVRPDGQGSCSATWDDSDEAWQVTTFPAPLPNGREQVTHLRNCLNKMLQAERDAAERAGVLRATTADGVSASGGSVGGGSGVADGGGGASVLQLLESSPDLERSYRVLHSIYASGMHEVSRQVATHCAERGVLLINMWTSSEALRERMLELRAERSQGVAAENQRLKAELAEAHDKLRALEGLEASHSTKAQELVRVAQSRDKLVEMMKTLQAALNSVEEQLRASQSGRRVAEARLRTWLPHYDSYSSPAALEALEAHSAASRDPSGLADYSAEELVTRAGVWRETVKAQAAQLADWEQPPSLPEQVPVGAEALKLLLNDSARILGAVLCLGELVEEDGEEVDGEDAKEGGANVPAAPVAAPAYAGESVDGGKGGGGEQGGGEGGGGGGGGVRRGSMGGGRRGSFRLMADAAEVARYQESISGLQQQLADSKSAQRELQAKLNLATGGEGEEDGRRRPGRMSLVLQHPGAASRELPMEPL